MATQSTQEPRRPNETYSQYWVRTHRDRYNELHRNYRAKHREEWNAYQREYNKKRRQDPSYVEKQRALSRKYYHESIDEIRQRQSARVKRLYHEDYEFREKKKATLKKRYDENEEHRQKMNTYAKEYARKVKLGLHTPKRPYKKAENKNVLLPVIKLIWKLTNQTTG